MSDFDDMADRGGAAADPDSDANLELTDEELGGLDSSVDRDSQDLDDVAVDAEEDQADDYLDDSSESDDLPWTPPESQPINVEIAYGSPDDDTEETIDQRIEQEEPEAGTAYGKPESGVDERREEYGLGDPDDVDLDESAEESAMHVTDE